MKKSEIRDYIVKLNLMRNSNGVNWNIDIDIVKECIRNTDGMHKILYDTVFYGKIPTDVINIKHIHPYPSLDNGSTINVTFTIRDDSFTISINYDMYKKYKRKYNINKLINE